MSDNPEDYELVHYGVKGMKWGRRKDGSTTASRILDTQKNNASNTSVMRSLTRRDGVTGVDVIKSKGNFKKAVASRNAKNVARIDRVQKGEASVRDMLITAGSVSIRDLVGSAGGTKAVAKRAAGVAKSNKVYSVDNVTNRFKKN